jgi:hypothetical protein
MILASVEFAAERPMPTGGRFDAIDQAMRFGADCITP